MDSGGDEQAELLIADRRLNQALLVLAGSGARRLRAGTCALLGDDRALAAIVPPGLLACRTAGEALAYFACLESAATAYDYLAAAVVLSWWTDATGTLRMLHEAHDRALAEKRFAVAVGARERLGHHALLFGDTESAAKALDDAMDLALRHRCLAWFVACAAAAARLALDAGNSTSAAQLLARARAQARSPDELALLAPIGAALAAESGDDSALREWTSADLLETALHSETLEAATAATIALLSRGAAPEGDVTIALRRVLLQAGPSTHAVELFTVAARYGGLEEARLAADATEAIVAPNRRYVKAHGLLARAQFLFRCGERAAWIDHAGDAARAFNAMGLRRWMNDAMLLLVRQEKDGFPRGRRGRPVGSALTGREQQVAHLIRRGARNREVAAALQISEHTVERHVSSILGRLGLRSRWQIADPRTDSEY